MIAHNVRALSLLLGHGVMLIGVSESGAQSVQNARERQAPLEAIAGLHQTISLMSILVVLLLLTAFFAISDDPKPYQKGLLLFSFAGFLVELAVACRVWNI